MNVGANANLFPEAVRSKTLKRGAKPGLMKQVAFKSGQPLVVEVPSPSLMPGFVLVKLRASCVSPGTQLAGIAMQGVRRAKVSLGERIAKIGCGSLGLLAIQMSRASLNVRTNSSLLPVRIAFRSDRLSTL